MSEWISVKDRLPEENVPVLVIYSTYPKMISTAVFAYSDCDEEAFSGWHWEDYCGFGFLNDPDNYEWDDDYDAIYWMPLPEPPEVETCNAPSA